MINRERQLRLLGLFFARKMQVSEDGEIQRPTRDGAWEKIAFSYPGKGGGPYVRRRVDGKYEEYPAAAVVLLWKLRKPIREEMHVGYEDGNPYNLHPDNICLWTAADYYLWTARRRRMKHQ